MRNYTRALRRAEKHLSAAEPRLAKLIAASGKCGLSPVWDRSPYESLVRAVAHQQLHAKAATAITNRLIARFPKNPFPSPRQVLSLSVEEMRGFGFSQPKTTAIFGIAEAAQSGVVPPREEAETLTDEELIVRLSALRGIGRWTVEMLLIFTLGQLDVMPTDDFGVKTGLQSLFGLKTFPKKPDFARLTDGWGPYRSVGAWYLWFEADRIKTTVPLKK